MLARRRVLRAVGTLVVTGLCLAYILWKIDLGRTGHVLARTRGGYLAGSVAIMVLSVAPLAWRWQLLLRARGVDEPLAWLARSYLVGYAAGQVLPTSLGGDATRVFETARRRPGSGGVATATVVMERVLGGAGTLLLTAVGFALAIGRYPVGAYVWVELAFTVAVVAVAILLFARSARRPLARLVPLLERLRLARPARVVYEALHAYRGDAPLLARLYALTVVVAGVRVLAIWLAGKAVGVDLSPLPYYVMGPLLFLVMLVPFTINGLAVRESFFVSFLGTLHVRPEPAFATGFLFFLVTIALSLPGVGLLAWEGLRGVGRPSMRSS